jgi:hypothetical protein
MRKIFEALTFREIEKHLAKMTELFVPEAKLTFMMRIPGNDETVIIGTSDDLAEVSRIFKLYDERHKAATIESTPPHVL